MTDEGTRWVDARGSVKLRGSGASRAQSNAIE